MTSTRTLALEEQVFVKPQALTKIAATQEIMERELRFQPLLGNGVGPDDPSFSRVETGLGERGVVTGTGLPPAAF